ncbi:MAG TPA: L-threonylcarbamoyladenylate synthase [Saprospiraceae bacterium]|nr:L-threonylcarbamoyladenylate synthase [Saprospiraceae bacterium]
MVETGKDLVKAKDLLVQGKLIAIPTETVYGLAGNALDTQVISRIFMVKNRPFFDPMILHTYNIQAIEDCITEWPDLYTMLMEHFMPGPLTLLCRKTVKVPDLLTAGSGKVAIRIPNHPLTLALLENLPFPLAAPSANPFGYISPTRPEHVALQLGNDIPYILDGGPCTVGVESTIIDFQEEQIKVLRKGGVSIEALEALCGSVIVFEQSTSNPSAPGMLHSHYAPGTPLVIAPPHTLLDHNTPDKIGYLAFRKSSSELPLKNQKILSESGNLDEAARNLFSYLRELDEAGLDIICAEWVPEYGLGRAINDKLRRASN